MIKRIVVLVVLGTALAISYAYPHDKERPDLDKWYPTLSNHNKGMCCDGSSSELIHLRDIDWETQNKEHSHYRVRIPATSMEDKNLIWVDVDDNNVVDDVNKDGSPLVWPYYYDGKAWIRCFLPGTMS